MSEEAWERLEPAETTEESAAALAAGKGPCAEAYAKWREVVNPAWWGDEALFERCYRGQYATVGEYAKQLRQELGVDDFLEALPWHLRRNVSVDMAGWIEDLVRESVIDVVPGTDGVHIFEPVL